MSRNTRIVSLEHNKPFKIRKHLFIHDSFRPQCFNIQSIHLRVTQIPEKPGSTTFKKQ